MDHFAALRDQEARCTAYVAAHPEKTVRENRADFFQAENERELSRTALESAHDATV